MLVNLCMYTSLISRAHHYQLPFASLYFPRNHPHLYYPDLNPLKSSRTMIPSKASKVECKPSATKWSPAGFPWRSAGVAEDDRKESARERGGSSQSGKEEAGNVPGMYVALPGCYSTGWCFLSALGGPFTPSRSLQPRSCIIAWP